MCLEPNNFALGPHVLAEAWPTPTPNRSLGFLLLINTTSSFVIRGLPRLDTLPHRPMCQHLSETVSEWSEQHMKCEAEIPQFSDFQLLCLGLALCLECSEEGSGRGQVMQD